MVGRAWLGVSPRYFWMMAIELRVSSWFSFLLKDEVWFCFDGD